MGDAPPAFQVAAFCAICSSAFSTFRRRHHCRCCGRSLCNEHSSNQMALPQFGINSAARVCDDCFESARQSSAEAVVPNADVDAVKATVSISRLSLSPDNSSPLTEESPAVPSGNQSFDCNCGMPLCICQAPTVPQVAPSTQAVTPVRSKKSTSISSATNFAASKPSASSSYESNLPSLFFASAQIANGRGHPLAKKYNATGEGIREAIKNGDVSAVKDLLMNGVDPNHFDKQGMSLLHLAAVFNFTEITFLLMDAGAKVDAKNAQGETPLDCAQATLQYKMRQKVQAITNNQHL